MPMSQKRADASAVQKPLSDGVEMWRWVCETYFEPEIDRRLDARKLSRDAVIDRAQVVFTFDGAPEVRIGGEVQGQEVVRSQLEVRKARDIEEAEDATGDTSSFELPPEEPDAGHVTAFLTPTGLDLVIHGAGDGESIESELEGADEYIDSAERILEGPVLGPFADAAHTATEMLARAELLRLPDPRLNSARTHDAVRSRYHLWAKLGNTNLRFAALLSSLAEWQRSAKYERSKFSLTAAKAADCMKTIAEMRCHAEHRPKRTLSVAPGQYVKLVAKR
jgi:hypothetical protein